MNAEYFVEMAVLSIAVVTAFSIFLNFFILVAEELKKNSIINKKKKNYAVLRSADKMAMQEPDGILGA